MLIVQSSRTFIEIVTYLHREAFEYNGSAAKRTPRTEVFLNEEDLGRRLSPRISAPPGTHCDLSVQSTARFGSTTGSSRVDKTGHVALRYSRDVGQLLPVR